MQDPLRLIVISSISLLLLCIGVTIYTFVYPKKKIHPFFLLILISLLPIISIFRPGGYESGDLQGHTKFLIGFYRMLSYGTVIPQWADLYCGGYGCPAYIFMYISPYYIASIFHAIGFSFVESIKLLLGTSFIASGIAMYFWIKEELGEQAGLLAGIFYLFAPYHLVDLHFRNAVGEMMAFVALPLCFLFTKKIITQAKLRWIILNALALCLLIFSHLAATLIVIPFLIIYSFLILLKKKGKKIQAFFSLILSFIISILLAAFYWLPVIYEGKYTLWGTHSAIYFFNDILYSPWRYGLLFQGHKGEHSHIVGYTQILIVLIACYFLLKKKIKNSYQKNLLLLFTISFFITTLMILPQSAPLWHIIPLIKNFQFSYRLLMFDAICTSIIAAIVLINIRNKKLVIFLCFITIAITILNWGNRRVVPEINDASISYELMNKNYADGEFTAPIWINDHPRYKKHRPQGEQLEIMQGHAEIKQLYNKPIEHEYVVNAKTNVLLRDNTFYYPGWIVLANDEPVSIINNNKNYPGTVVFKLKKGIYKIDVKFIDTVDRSLGKNISLISALILVILAVDKLYWRLNSRRK